MNTRQRYPSDLTDLQWDNIEHLFPQTKGKIGRPGTYPLREIVNAALYLARGQGGPDPLGEDPRPHELAHARLLRSGRSVARAILVGEDRQLDLRLAAEVLGVARG